MYDKMLKTDIKQPEKNKFSNRIFPGLRSFDLLKIITSSIELPIKSIIKKIKKIRIQQKKLTI